MVWSQCLADSAQTLAEIAKALAENINSLALPTRRNMPEMVRLMTALQTPADWQVGDKVIVPPARTQAEAIKRTEDKIIEYVDFYFCKKDL